MPNVESEKREKNKPLNSEIWITATTLLYESNAVTTVKIDTKKKTCEGICQFYETSGLQNNVRYKAGQKRCSHCQVYMIVDVAKCPCCKTTLRTKPRSKRVWNQLQEIPAL